MTSNFDISPYSTLLTGLTVFYLIKKQLKYPASDSQKNITHLPPYSTGNRRKGSTWNHSPWNLPINNFTISLMSCLNQSQVFWFVTKRAGPQHCKPISSPYPLSWFFLGDFHRYFKICHFVPTTQPLWLVGTSGEKAKSLSWGIWPKPLQWV